MEGKNDIYDVVVIGAGLGGLSAAGMLAKAGKRVLVLEHHTVPGGYAHGFRRGHFRFDVSLHAMDGVNPGGWAYTPLKDLEVLGQVKFNRLDPFYTVQFPHHTITVPADLYAYEAELMRAFPEQADGLRKMINQMLLIYHDVQRFIQDGEAGIRPSIEEVPIQYPNFLPVMGQSFQDFMDAYIDDPQLQAVFSILWGYYGLPPSQLNAATFIFPWVSYHLHGAFYPEGGSMAISRALEATLLKYGGEVRYKQTATKFDIQDGRLTGVHTDKGLHVGAEIVISNANAPDTMLKMVGEEHLPSEYLQKVKTAEENPAMSNLVVYLGLDRDLKAEGWSHHELFVAPGYDLDKEYEKVEQGRFNELGVTLTYYNHADPECSPPGTSILGLFTLAPWDYADVWGTNGDLTNYSQNPRYLKFKQDAAEALLDAAEKKLPGLRDSIKYIEVGTPITNHRYSLNPAGAIYGSAQTVDNMYFSRLNAETPIPNLYLASAWSFGGGMSAAMLAGRDTARLVIQQTEGQALTSLTEVYGMDLLQGDDDKQDLAVQSGQDAAMENRQLPAVTLTAAGSRRQVTLNSLDAPTLFLLHTQDSAEQASAVNAGLRQTYPDAKLLQVVNMVDLQGIPKLFRSMAEGAMKKSYTQAQQLLDDGLAPEDYILILPDWQGQFKTRFDFSDLDEQIGLLAVQPDGSVIGAEQPQDAVSAAQEMAARLLAG